MGFWSVGYVYISAGIHLPYMSAVLSKGTTKMKFYVVAIADYDLYGEYGCYVSREKAEQRMAELKKAPDFLWKKYLEIREKELIE